MRAELHPFRLALRAPLVTGRVSLRFRAGFLVALSADGITGWGEASPLPGWSRTSLLETEAALRRACDGLAEGGEAVLDPLLTAMHDTPHARAGVAGAWADLQARRAGQSLAEHLVADVANSPAAAVAVNALIAAPEPSEVEQAVQDAVRAGFQAVKLKVGAADTAIDVERVQSARGALGSGADPAVDVERVQSGRTALDLRAELRLDANGSWDSATALDVLGQVHDCGIAYCEEPVAGIDAIAELGRRSPVPIAADESIRNEADAVQALDQGISTLIIKPQALGGPDVALSIAARAHEAGASVVVTSFLDSAVGLTHALHVAAAVDATAPHRQAHGLATAELLAADVAEAPPVADGAIAVPAAPGLGLAPDSATSPDSAP